MGREQRGERDADRQISRIASGYSGNELWRMKREWSASCGKGRRNRRGGRGGMGGCGLGSGFVLGWGRGWRMAAGGGHGGMRGRRKSQENFNHLFSFIWANDKTVQNSLPVRKVHQCIYKESLQFEFVTVKARTGNPA
ncbi:unnamed protein product [Prunus armeniaca]